MRFLVPVSMLLALAFGGSALAAVNVLFLEAIGIGLIVWAYADPASQRQTMATRRAILLGWAAMALAAFQLIPLPASVWGLLPGRDVIVSGDAALSIAAAWRPLSVVPDATFAGLLKWTVPLGILVAGLRRPTSRAGVASAILAAGIVGATLGLAQITQLAPHFFAFHSPGATGQFANSNHLATLAVAAIPMAAALAVHHARRAASTWAMAAIAAIVLCVVCVRTGSLAMMALLLPILALSALIAIDRQGAGRWVGIGFLALAGVAALILGIGFLADQGIGTSLSTRIDIWRAATGLWPWMFSGAGFGTFETLFHLVEDPFFADRTFINHAHNDWLQLAIEGGIPGVLLAGLFAVWVVFQSWRAWRGGLEADPFARAGSLGIFILAVHSLVDFPLRTPAHLALLAGCTVLLATRRLDTPLVEEGDLRATRHRRIA